jgi:exopolyphosphatase/guanosine-5'-triphosphate,3'-diphosphate pyrophosphatase
MPAGELVKMRVGVIDVGANTLRLLVAARAASGLAVLHRERVQLGLGDFIEQEGSIPLDLLDAAGRAAREQAASARRLGCARIEVVVTSPGRQAENADELVASLTRVRGATVRILTAEEEASFAYRGVCASVDDAPDSIAVCDVGGGSTQIAVGACDEDPSWVRSLDVGSLRLTRRALADDPPTTEAIDSAREHVEPLFAGLTPPLPQAAYATGGSARALGKLVGPRLGAEELAVALRIVAERPSRRLAKTFDLSPTRAHTLAAGALLLVCTQRLLGVPLEVARAGLREGVALSLLAEAAVAA